MAEKIPGFVERLLLPKLSMIEGELKALNGRIEALKGEMQGELKSINTRIDEMDRRFSEKIDGMDKRLTERMESLSEKVDVVRDIERLKIEVEALKQR